MCVHVHAYVCILMLKLAGDLIVVFFSPCAVCAMVVHKKCHQNVVTRCPGEKTTWQEPSVSVCACVCVRACVCASSKWQCWALWLFDKDRVAYLRRAFHCQPQITIFPPHPLGALGWLFDREPSQLLRATVTCWTGCPSTTIISYGTQQPPSPGLSGVRLATSPIPDNMA